MKQVAKYLCKMFKYSSREILCIWLLDLLYSGIILFTPMLIGRVIDEIVNGEYQTFIWLIFVLFIEVIIGYIYRRYDTRIYEQIASHFKQEYFSKTLNKELTTTEIDANVELVDEFSEFLRFLIIKLMAVAGIIILLIYLHNEADIYVMFAVIVTMLLVLLFQILRQRGMQQEISRIRDENEKRRDIIGERDILPYRSFLNRVMGLSVSHSDKDAIVYTVSSILQLGLLAFVVWYVVSSNIATAGVIFATITYIMEINDKTFEMQEIYADIFSMKDSITRIDM